jgi:asparagine synthase (glutamine-hydrolysing)
MCGIYGEIRWDGRSADVAALSWMTGAMVSRGPDSDGVFAHGPVALGHRRLSIIDLSARGAQPMVDSDLGLTLVFNGCVYNYKDLRKELEDVGYQFFSTADSEVVIKAFHCWGTGCVDRFKGMFAFAIADRDTGVVTLARDRGRGVVGVAGQRPGCEERARSAEDGQARRCLVGQVDREGPAAAIVRAPGRDPPAARLHPAA